MALEAQRTAAAAADIAATADIAAVPATANAAVPVTTDAPPRKPEASGSRREPPCVSVASIQVL
jgi:hypothetical protein